MSLSARQIAVGGLDKNFAYVIIETESKECYLVDPSGSILPALNIIQDNDLTLRGIVLTHSHTDHFDQLDVVLDLQPAPVLVHERGVSAVTSGEVYPMRDGQELPLGKFNVAILHTPGHSDDSICLFIKAEDSDKRVPYLISGDTLFVKGCGNTTPEHVAELYNSLQRLKTLPDETVILPGHDYGQAPTSTLAIEKTQNLFMMTESLEGFTRIRLPDGV